MPWEQVGDCGDGQMPGDREWLVCQLELGIRYLRCVCGEPPKGFDLEIMWHEHELCDYPMVGICWDIGETGFDPPWEYIGRCSLALQAFDEAISWSQISPDLIQERFQSETVTEDDSEQRTDEEPECETPD